MHQLVVTGAMCSGKTTLLRSFAADSRIIGIDDQARRYLQEHPQVDRQSLAANQAIVAAYRAATAQAREAEECLASIADGSVLNPVAHLRAWGDKHGAETILQEVRPDLRAVTMFFLMDIDDIPYVLDEVRTESQIVRQRLQ
jgi:nicotinamide riboside kinase